MRANRFAEMFFDECRALLIHGLGQMNGIGLTLALALQAADFFLKGRVDEDVQRAGALMQIIRGAPTHNHSLTLIRDPSYDVLGGMANAFGVRYLHVRVGIQDTFVAAAKEGLEQAIVRVAHPSAIHAPRLAGCDRIPDGGRFSSVRAWSHNSQPSRSRQLSSARSVTVPLSVLAFNCQDVNHGFVLPYSAWTYSACTWPPALGSFFLTINANRNMMLAATASILNVSM